MRFLAISIFILFATAGNVRACEGFEDATDTPTPPPHSLKIHHFQGRVDLRFYDPFSRDFAWMPLEPLTPGDQILPNSPPLQMVQSKSGVNAYPLHEGKVAYAFQGSAPIGFHGVVLSQDPVQLQCREEGGELAYTWDLDLEDSPLPLLLQTTRFSVTHGRKDRRDFRTLKGSDLELRLRCEHQYQVEAGRRHLTSYTQSWSLNGETILEKIHYGKGTDEDHPLHKLSIPVLASSLPGVHIIRTPGSELEYHQLRPELSQVSRTSKLTHQRKQYYETARLQWSDGTSIANPEQISWTLSTGRFREEGKGPIIEVTRPSYPNASVKLTLQIPTYPEPDGGYVTYLSTRKETHLGVDEGEIQIGRTAVDSEGSIEGRDFKAGMTAEIFVFGTDKSPSDIRWRVYLKDIESDKNLGALASGRGPNVVAEWNGREPSPLPNKSESYHYTFAILARMCLKYKVDEKGWFLDNDWKRPYPELNQ